MNNFESNSSAVEDLDEVEEKLQERTLEEDVSEAEQLVADKPESEKREEIPEGDPEKDVENIKYLYEQQTHFEKQIRSDEEVLQKYDLQIQQETDSDKKAQLEKERTALVEENQENRKKLQETNDALANVGE